ncbi:OB-fold domain-containing protein [Streptomyces oryzae]|uniref:OB-fold domain-containing protein n=1 Tax=Streptomyces oryzae TaxID=1434886 RepID=A0ABS3XMC4_9ACTN|nr:OB-fold domain-containing protein [Streptomyces oryzae]
MIRHWCEALGHPVPPDGSAPATMLQVWTMAGLAGRGDSRSGPYGALLSALDGAGCTSVVATDCEQEYLRPLCPGDEITFDAVIESVSPRKTTKLGTGYFVTTRMDVLVGAELVGTHRFRILKYRPARPRTTQGGAAASGADADAGTGAGATAGAAGGAGAGAGSDRPRRPRPVVNRDNAGFWEGVARHQLLFQRCAECGTPRFPWLPGCNACGCAEWRAVAACGRGTVYSYVVMHHPPFPAFDPPYAVALVQLEEGVRIVSNLTGVRHDDVRIGMPVELEFLRVDDDLELPVFRGAALPRVGDQLPPLDVPVTRTLIVSGALAARDFQDVHHDAEAARQKGSPDIFMNILTTNGLVGRYVVQWAGPHALLRKVAIRLGAPNHPGDTMALSGQVTAVTPPAVDAPEGEGVTVEIAVRGANRLGNHVTGTVTVTLWESPAGPEGAPS